MYLYLYLYLYLNLYLLYLYLYCYPYLYLHLYPILHLWHSKQSGWMKLTRNYLQNKEHQRRAELIFPQSRLDTVYCLSIVKCRMQCLQDWLMFGWNSSGTICKTKSIRPADCPAMSFVFVCWHSSVITNKYQKYKSVELGDQLASDQTRRCLLSGRMQCLHDCLMFGTRT